MARASTAAPSKASAAICRFVEQTMHGLDGSEPHSLCELRITPEQYAKLAVIVGQHLTPSLVRQTSWYAGAIMLHFIAETARREAAEGHVWSGIADRFAPPTRAEFFVQGHPTRECKELLRESAKRFNLRNVHGWAGVQEWYDTIYLQFGFTRRGMERHLPEWLAGQSLPLALRLLLYSELRSSSFVELWEALRFYRRDRITLRQLRDVLRNSPWVLPEWHEDLVRLARDRPELTDEEACSESEGSPVSLINEQRVIWLPPNAPCCESRVARLVGSPLISPHYLLQCGETILATLFRQPDGSYRSDHSHVKLPLTEPEALLRLVDSEGQGQYTQLVDLWDNGADVSAIDLTTGQRVDESIAPALRSQHSYLLVLQRDLILDPAPPFWHWLVGPQKRLAVYVPAGWPPTLSVRTEGGTTVWQPTITVTARREEPAWARDVTVGVPSKERTVPFGSILHPTVRGLPSNASLVFVRVGGFPSGFHGNTLAPLRVTPEFAQTNLAYHLGIHVQDSTSCQRLVHIHRALDVAIEGVAQHTSNGWQPLAPNETLTVHAAQATAYRLFSGAKDGKMAIMEGMIFRRWFGGRAGPLGRLSGLGAPVVLWKQPYNDTGTELAVARGVVDGGIVASVRPNPQSRTWEIHLTVPLMPTAAHSVLIWGVGRDGDLRTTTAIDSCDSGRRWCVPMLQVSSTCITALAICYKGSWLGTGCTGPLEDAWTDWTGSTNDAVLTAALARWFRLPVLLRDRRKSDAAFAPFAHAHADAVLAAWVDGTGLPDSLRWTPGVERREAEAATLRARFAGWSPSPTLATAVVERLGAEGAGDPLSETLFKVFDTDPLLTGHLLRNWLRERGSPQGTIRWYLNARRKLLEHDIPAEAGMRPLEIALERAARKLTVDPRTTADPHFVRTAIADPALATLDGARLNELQTKNYRVALEIASFRQYLALRVLEESARRA